MKSFFYGLFSILLMLGSVPAFAQIGIGTKTPAASAALEVSSSANNKGILIPRLTGTQKDAIVSPAEGLLIYQTTAPIGFYYYTGGAWKLMAIQTDLAGKVDKVDGKNLSTNDYTTAEKTKLSAVTGTNTGDQTTISGNAGTATKLASPRNINGVAFDGTTDISIAAAASAEQLTGTTIKSTVTGSSLTSVGTLANLTVSNPIAGSITGNAATATTATTVTKNANLTGPVTSVGNATSITDGAITNAKITDVAATKITGTLPVANGGTGAATAAAARTNLELGNVDNTTDLLKPISTLTQNALDLKGNATDITTSLALKANLASPTFTGVLTANSTTALNDNVTVAAGKTLTVGTGATTLGGTLAVTGTTTLTGAAILNGGLTMDTDKFTVADATGNTTIGGTLAVTGASTLNDNVTVAAGKTLTVGTGATTLGGTLAVAGASTLSSATVNGKVIVGASSAASSSAVLEASSTTQGFLPPRMTSSQRDAIVLPAEGLLIYNTTTKSIEVYTGASGGGESFLSGNEFCSTTMGNVYGLDPFTNQSQWSNLARGMAQSFVSGGGNLSSITIKVGSVISESTSTLYQLNVYNGSPSGCGNNGTTCALSALGTPIATSQVSINSAGAITLNLASPVSLTLNQTYTFSITPTVSTQGFMWNCYTTGYSSGASFGVSGNISGANDDFKFQTNYIPAWRSLL